MVTKKKPKDNELIEISPFIENFSLKNFKVDLAVDYDELRHKHLEENHLK